MAQLKPQRVIAGHFLGETKADTSIIQFTADYIRDFERMNGQSNNAAELTEKMKAEYPKLHEEGTLEFSAKVVKGDIKWPQ